MNKYFKHLFHCHYLYSSNKDALKFFASLIKDKTIIIFDDWLLNFEKHHIGEKKGYF